MRTSAMVRNRIEQLQHVVRRDLAAQVQEMLGLQQIGIRQRVEIDDAVAERADALLVEAQIAEAQRVEHGGHAGGGALRVMRHHRRARRPARQRARLHLALQIVGVHIDDARDQVVAVHIVRAGQRRTAGLHVRDTIAVSHHHGAAHVPHPAAPASALVRIVSSFMRLPATASPGTTGRRSRRAPRHRGRWRRSRVPRAFASWIMPITTRRGSRHPATRSVRRAAAPDGRR